jgi:hypothetical protein
MPTAVVTGELVPKNDQALQVSTIPKLIVHGICQSPQKKTQKRMPSSTPAASSSKTQSAKLLVVDFNSAQE